MELNRGMVRKLLRLSDEARVNYFFLRTITQLPQGWNCEPLQRVSEKWRLFYFVAGSLLPACPFEADAESVRRILGEVFPALSVEEVREMLAEFSKAGLLCLYDEGAHARLGWWMPLSETGAVMEPPRFTEMPDALRKVFADCLQRARPN